MYVYVRAVCVCVCVCFVRTCVLGEFVILEFHFG